MSEAHAAWASPVRARGLIPRRVGSPPSRCPGATAGALRGSGRIDSGIEQRRGERHKLIARSKLAPSPPRA